MRGFQTFKEFSKQSPKNEILHSLLLIEIIQIPILDF